MKKRQVSIVIITLAIITMGYMTMLFLNSQRSFPERRSPVIPDRYVKAEMVDYKKIISPILATGRMTSSQTIDIISEASGKIESGNILFKKGEAFKKGDVLVKIYDDEAQLALKARKSRFLNSLALLLPDIKIDFPSKYDAFIAFFDSIKLDNDLPNLPNITGEKIKIYLASRNILNDYFTIKGEELRVKRYVIKAPFDGALLSVNQEVGSYAGMGARLAKIINTGNLELELPIKDSKSKWVAIGDKVKIITNKLFTGIEGKLVRKSDFIDISTQSRTVYVKITKGFEKIVWGQYMEAQFEGKPIKAAMEIPRNAVFNYNQVFIVFEGKLFKREVNIIKQNDTSVVFDGLENNVFVVTEPLIDARENSEVKILK
jgi:multidrug efflux pump subunit AcrA (membrane-fusion protein)